jgi:hypothetical protein
MKIGSFSASGLVIYHFFFKDVLKKYRKEPKLKAQ